MAAPRILFFSPYANWLYHTGLEASWIHALRLRGATVAMSTCQGMFPVCGIYKLATNPRPPDACQRCRVRVDDVIRVLGLPDLPLDGFVTATDKRAVKTWVQALAPQDLLQAEYEGQPVGTWAASSAHTQVRMNKLRLELPEVREMVRGQVEGAALGLSTLTQTLQCSASGCALIARSGVSPARATAPAHIVDAGTAPAMAASVDAASGRIVVAAVHSDAFCANNEKRNKQVGCVHRQLRPWLVSYCAHHL